MHPESKKGQLQQPWGSDPKVKENDRVIAVGTWDKNGVLHATLISKRLTRENEPALYRV